MSYIFIELFSYKDKWRNETPEFRAEFADKIISTIPHMPELGIELIAYGFNDLDTDARAPYDFYSLYRVANKEAQVGFEGAVRQSGWLEYMDQVGVRGLAKSGEDILRANVQLEMPS